MSGAQGAFSAKDVPAVIRYDQTSNSYTLTVDNRTQTFRPADLDTTQSNASVAVYVRTNGSTTDSLTLTKPGTSGTFNFKYVGGAFWQRTTESKTTISGTFDALVYGAMTPDAGVPRSGQAQFDVAVLGAVTQNGGLGGVSGVGSLQADFATGGLAYSASLNSTLGGGSSLQGAGKVSSGANQFTGSFYTQFDGIGMPGTMDGAFFGPEGEEIGAVLRAAGGNGQVFVGAMMGRQASTVENADFTSLAGPEFWSATRSRLVFDSTGDTSAARVVSRENGAAVVGYDPGVPGTVAKYNFFLPEKTSAMSSEPSQYGLAGDSLSYAGLSYTSKNGSGWLRMNGYSAPLKYTSAVRLFGVSGNRYTFDDMLFGFTSPANVLTGQAGFSTQIVGTHIGVTEAPTIMGGWGNLSVDFATGNVAAVGSLYSLGGVASPRYNANASLGAASSGFSGTFNISDNTPYSGTWTGGFFGPGVDEVGATFSASNGTDVAAGVLFGTRKDSVLAADTPLAELTKATTMRAGEAYVYKGQATRYTAGYETLGFVSYDPVSGTYVFGTDDQSNLGTFPLDAQFSAADRVAAESDASYTTYRKADGSASARILVTNAANPVIALTYASFAEVTQNFEEYPGFPTSDKHYIYFGQKTSEHQLPASGTATYSGIALGGGHVEGFSGQAEVEGTFGAQVDFARMSISANLDVTAKDAAGVGADLDVPTATYAGTIYGADFQMAVKNGAPSDFLNGSFYGPNGQEIAGLFSLSVDYGATGNLTGVVLGKQN